MLTKFFILKKNCYLYYLSYRINNISCVQDVIYLIKNISFYKYNSDSDYIINTLIDCFQKYPLREEKMRILSVLQQNYQSTNGIEDYCCIVLWLAIIYSTNKNNNLLL